MVFLVVAPLPGQRHTATELPAMSVCRSDDWDAARAHSCLGCQRRVFFKSRPTSGEPTPACPLTPTCANRAAAADRIPDAPRRPGVRRGQTLSAAAGRCNAALKSRHEFRIYSPAWFPFLLRSHEHSCRRQHEHRRASIVRRFGSGRKASPRPIWMPTPMRSCSGTFTIRPAVRSGWRQKRTLKFDPLDRDQVLRRSEEVRAVPG